MTAFVIAAIVLTKKDPVEKLIQRNENFCDQMERNLLEIHEH